MKPKEHKQRHIELHKSLDELFTDYILHHPKQIKFTEMPLIKLLKWSHKQTIKPTELKE